MTDIPDDKTSCDNCNIVLKHEFSNEGFICSGIVIDPFRNCDVIRTCQKYDDGQIFLEDKSLDEALILSNALSLAATEYLRFGYKRPCNNCPDETCEDLNSGEERWEIEYMEDINEDT